MGTFLNRMNLHRISTRFKRFNPLHTLLILVLFAGAYFAGNFHVNPVVPNVTQFAVQNSDCETPIHTSPNPNSNSNATQSLDFQPHHSAEDLSSYAPSTNFKTINIPPCDSKWFEYTPCEDVDRSLKFPRDRLIYRERHCPTAVEKKKLTCQVPAPFGYRVPVRWPESRDSVWFANVPHKWLTVEKAGQNWIRVDGQRFRFPGGGTMFPHGADSYIDDIGKLIDLTNGSIRTAIDTGCGVASFGAYLMSRNVLTVSFAPKDTHVAQVQFALERGVPALLGVLASNKLPYPARAFDLAHCSRCLIPWSQYDGIYLMEVDRVLRPGGYWILSGPPINWEKQWKGWERSQNDLKSEQDGIENLAKSLCWKKVGQNEDIAIWQKPTNHVHCKFNRKVFHESVFCPVHHPDNAWYDKMEKCLTPLPEQIGGGELAKWPERLTAVPPRIKELRGVTDEIFNADTKLWAQRVSYYKKLDYKLLEQGRYRNLLDMNAHFGGFAAAMIDHPVWVMNVVPVEAEINTLGVVFERGLIGTYQNWCEAMSTYPRTYDFIHADSVFTLYNNRCEATDILIEMDRVLRPEGSIMFRDDVEMIVKIRSVLDGMKYESRIIDHENGPLEREKILLANKLYWTAPPPPSPSPSTASLQTESQQ